MMAANRYRLKHQAQRGARGAKLALALLGQDRQAARRDPARQHARRRGGRHAHGGDHQAAVRRRRARAGAWHDRDLVRAARVLRDHAESGRRGARRPARAAGELRAGADAARAAPDRLVRQPVRAGHCCGCSASTRRRRRARRCRRKSCARSCWKAANIFAASTRRCSPT